MNPLLRKFFVNATATVYCAGEQQGLSGAPSLANRSAGRLLKDALALGVPVLIAMTVLGGPAGVRIETQRDAYNSAVSDHVGDMEEFYQKIGVAPVYVVLTDRGSGGAVVEATTAAAQKADNDDRYYLLNRFLGRNLERESRAATPAQLEAAKNEFRHIEVHSREEAFQLMEKLNDAHPGVYSPHGAEVIAYSGP